MLKYRENRLGDTMPQHQIHGTTFTGITVEEGVRAVSVKAALRYIFIKYGRLRKPYDVFVQSTLAQDYDVPNADRLRPIDPLLADEDVLRIAALLKANEWVEEEELLRFRAYFRPMLRRAIRDLWRDVNVITKEDAEQELYEDIIREFMPKYKRKRGRIRTFIRMKIEGRLKRNWKREKYINADKKSTAKSKHEIMEQYAYLHSLPIEQESNPEDDRMKLIEASKKVISDDYKLSLNERRVLFQWVVRSGLHYEFLRRPRQKNVLDLLYGSTQMKEIDAAAALGVSQPTIHSTKIRAEQNYFNYIQRNFY